MTQTSPSTTDADGRADRDRRPETDAGPDNGAAGTVPAFERSDGKGAVPSEEKARLDWEKQLYDSLTDTSQAPSDTELPAPTGLTATGARGHTRLSWEPVAGAAGYVLERRDGDAPARLVGHGGADVPAVPDTKFADTGLAENLTYHYRVGAVTGAEFPVWHWSEPVEATILTEAGDVPTVDVTVHADRDTGSLDRVWTMIGSERLTQLRFGADASGHDIGTEFEQALRIAHDDLGVDRVRAHAILHDDNHVVSRRDDGTLAFDFAVVDELYDRILALGIKPVVELGFMPAAIASDPDETVFTYRGIISPPRDWSEWHEVVKALTQHLVDRYGLADVATWGFEVWNEPNLLVFWTGTQDDYLRMYAESARAVKSVDASLLVGGPSTAASKWIEALAAFSEKEQLPLDFVSSHTYGNMPLDTRDEQRRHGFDAPIWWTEWGAGSTHFGSIHDSVLGAPFVLSGYHDVQGRMAALSYWVVSDHFEELGRPPRLFHDGFGLLTVGNLRKPRYWAAHLAAHQGDTVVTSEVTGDGADVLVQAWATRHDDGAVDVLVWNGTINGALLNGDPRLDRTVSLTVDGLDATTYDATLARVDAKHSNIVRHAPSGVDWPDDAQFARLRELDVLHEESVTADVSSGRAAVTVAVPMPGVVRVRLTPQAK